MKVKGTPGEWAAFKSTGKVVQILAAVQDGWYRVEFVFLGELATGLVRLNRLRPANALDRMAQI